MKGLHTAGFNTNLIRLWKMIPLLRDFDTGIDTTKMFVPMNVSFVPHNYVNKKGYSRLYIHVTENSNRLRQPLNIYVPAARWSKSKEQVIGKDQATSDLNLVIDVVKAKITNIKKQYDLNFMPLTAERFLFEFNNDMPTANFVQFFKTVLEDRKSTIETSTYMKEQSIYNKLKRYSPVIQFFDITEDWFMDFRNHLADIGNNKRTRNGNIKIIKKYLRFAKKKGIKLLFDIDDIKSGSTQGQKSYLNSKEVKILYDYYFSSHIPRNQKICIGYFLFSCFTGLRSSDNLNQDREVVLTGYFQFKHIKTKKLQNIELNDTALKIAKHCEALWVQRYNPDHIRRVVKDICSFLQISKRVDFHMSRHTFGTNYILLGGDVHKLQILMGHSDIRETMVYVHLADMERNAKADLMDKLFD